MLWNVFLCARHTQICKERENTHSHMHMITDESLKRHNVSRFLNNRCSGKSIFIATFANNGAKKCKFASLNTNTEQLQSFSVLWIFCCMH